MSAPPAKALVGTITLLAALVVGVVAGAYWHDTIGGWFGAKSQATASESPEPTAQKQWWTCGMHPQVIQDKPGDCPICHMQLTPLAVSDDAATGAEPKQRKIKYYWDPMMSPPYISDKPGKSPMGMDLIPVYEDEISAGTSITIDPRIVQNMGVRVARVEQKDLTETFRAAGYITERTPDQRDINLRVNGWIERLYADTEGMALEKGQPLFDLYSPEVQVAVDELVTATKMAAAATDDLSRKTTQTLIQTARRKLVQWGLDAEQIERLAQLDRAPYTVTFLSPISGFVTEKMVVQGGAVKAGDLALRLNNREKVWLDIAIYERQLPLVTQGTEVRATTLAVPGKTFAGKVIFVHPNLDDMSRSALVRIELVNDGLHLRQGMYATAEITSQPLKQALVVPREAVIDSGTRKVVFVTEGESHFAPREVTTGLETLDGQVQVLSGLAPDEQIVVSGQFLFDSESRMREAIQKQLKQQLLRGGAEPGPETQQPPIGIHQH